MNTIDKDELFGHISQFLKAKGVDLQAGSYTRTIQKGCQVLADTINLSQQAVERAKVGIEKKLDQARQVIHEKTAPRKPPVQPNSKSAKTPPKAASKRPTASSTKSSAKRRGK